MSNHTGAPAAPPTPPEGDQTISDVDVRGPHGSGLLTREYPLQRVRVEGTHLPAMLRDLATWLDVVAGHLGEQPHVASVTLDHLEQDDACYQLAAYVYADEYVEVTADELTGNG